MVAALLNSLLSFPRARSWRRRRRLGLPSRRWRPRPADRERLHGWWVPTRGGSAGGHVLLCHGNAGNVGDRVLHAALLSAAGLDVLLFDYRGYGRSSGRPSEPGTYRDAHAARSQLLAPGRVRGSGHLPRRVARG